MASYSERDAPNLEVYPRFTNDLPDVPFPPKFLPCSFDINRLAAYRDTSLIQSYQYKLHAPADVGVNVNLLRPEDYNPKRSAHDQSFGSLTELTPTPACAWMYDWQNFAAYFLPTVDTTNRLCTYAQDAERKGVAEGEVFEYDKIREFQFDVETRDDRYIGTGLEDYFLFYEHDNLINYTRLERTLKLSQRRGMSTTRREILRMTHNSQEPDDEEDDEDFGGTAGGNGDGELEGEANGTATPVGETVANQEESVATD
ncbi:uncharacterized protein MONBRDRAFT_9509 [Monosiga brevicollis MX1]|uniref:RNA polymerase II-associated factor 1 homolog n=1 Tax=Monosiga brevicollis TaxID=81824 RepID=A9V3D5_MONBE|nr:uncharacterized protein MONBRDRAFT_9509 [Monosiga brevicollis MX1]EDQ88170.1 predicted protein [Monosiga brevicollis MX1]|eukprot:XP_001747246.1 hypothetical protein [Monosiga brevicollis MX1]